MHEYGLAADIVHGVLERSEAEGGRQLAVLEVEVGALERLETDTLAFWLAEELADHLGDPTIDADRIRVLRTPLTLKCGTCGQDTVVPMDDDLVLLDPLARRCAACGSEDVTAVGGTGWTIRAGWEERPAGGA